VSGCEACRKRFMQHGLLAACVAWRASLCAVFAFLGVPKLY
jgi:hypothetical protein